MAETVTLRPATPADTRAIAELYRDAADGVADYIWEGLRDDHPDCKDILDIGARRYARENTDFSYQNCLMAEVAGTPAGMAMAYAMGDVETLPDDFDPVLRPYAELEAPHTLYIAGVAVFPAFRGRGVGTVLMDALADKAGKAGLNGLSLIVFEQNAGALRLYKRLGFKEAARRSAVAHPLIRHTGDALLMVKP